MSRSEASEGQAGQGGGGVSLGPDGRFELLPGVRLPRLDSPHAEAYEARDLREPDRPHFALICRRELLPRVDILERVSRIDRKQVSILSIVASGSGISALLQHHESGLAGIAFRAAPVIR